MANSTDIIGYIHTHGSMMCLPCVANANEALVKENYEPIENDHEFDPYFESDRQGGETCDVCYGVI